MASRVPIGGGRQVAAELASVFLAMLLLSAGSPSWAQAGDTAGGIAGAIEIVSWNPAYPDNKGRQICRIEGESVACTVSSEKSGVLTVTGGIKGRISGNRITGIAEYDVVGSNGTCDTKQFHRHDEEIVLSPGGTLTQTHSEGVSTITAVFGAACPPEARSSVGREYRASAPTHMVGTWRLLAAGAGTASVRIEGNTIFVTDGSGTERVLTLVPPTKASPPAFNPPTVSGEAKAFEKYLMTHMFEASYAHLPPDQRQNFISGMPMPSDVAGEAAQAVLNAGESAANWVRDNPADASLMVLSTAVSLAFPLSAFANPAVATGGAAVLRGVVGTAMVAGTSGFVQKLMSNVFTDQTALQRFKEAAAKGAGDAVATVPGSLTGAGVEKAAEQIIGKAAVTAGSVMVGITTDKAMEKLQVSEKTVALVMKAPSYASSLLSLPGPSLEAGGMSLNFDR